MTRIHFNEVVTRDGFQNEPAFVPTDAKVALIDELSACGYAKIEVTSFTSAKAIPMLRDAEEVMGRIRRVAGVETTVLVPNVRGAQEVMLLSEALAAPHGVDPRGLVELLCQLSLCLSEQMLRAEVEVFLADQPVITAASFVLRRPAP